MHDVIINATPVGMKWDVRLPINLEAFNFSTLVAYIAVLDLQTELLKAAQAKVCMTTAGNDMLRARIKLITGFATGAPVGTEISGCQ
ncbi:hypothetical protein [Pararhizobium sp. IMCC21322]|uniref:hypothetical protein n=1 Tax=Pararhizobium sp. IMCC21322 TaxID=3067903 RepID=UPI002740F1A8|nr:hypothetical protein [Pararhizobium sp. IMCC21322]